MTFMAICSVVGVVACLGNAIIYPDARLAWLIAATWASVAFLFAIGWA